MIKHRTPFLQVLRGFAVLLALSGVPLHAQEVQRVAAVVNDDIISVLDLEQRIRLGLASTNLPDTVESRSRIAPQVLRGLIDERLKIQEATRLKIAISPPEIANSLNSIERQNNMPPGSLESFLKSRNINIETMREQTRAELAWVRVIRHELMPDLHIGEAEIDQRLSTIKENFGKPEYLVAEIYLAVDDPRRDAEVRSLAERLIDQLRQGAPFPALARQFSQTGAAGGDLGWVSEGMLDTELTKALTHLDRGNVTPPIRTIDGYHIMLLRDKRIAGEGEASEPLYDILTVQMPILPGSTQAERDAQLTQIRSIFAPKKSCDDEEKEVKQTAAEFTRNAKVKRSEIPPAISALLNNLPLGQISDPLDESGTRRMFALCGQTEPTGVLPSRDDIRTRLENEQIEILAQRYLRDLRRAAFIEIRI
jgi:peptidyl-prolyl cis-trans isomerase SurA